MAHFNHEHETVSTKSMICAARLCQQEALGIPETKGGGLAALASLSSWLARPLS